MSERLLDAAMARARAREALGRERPGREHGLGCLKNRDEPMQSQVLVAAHPDGCLTVKLWAEDLGDKAAAQAARQRSVAQKMATGPWRAPGVLFFDPELLCLGMEYVDGPSLAALWPVMEPPAQEIALHEAGAWIAAFHRPSLRRHPFRPKGQIAWLNRLEGWQAEGARHIPEIAAFRAEVRRMEAMFDQVRGLPGTRAITHRDLHLDNLLRNTAALSTEQAGAVKDGPVNNGPVQNRSVKNGPEQEDAAQKDAARLTGVDFENAKEDEPHRDLVWLLIDALARSDAGDPARLGAAIARGYDDRITALPARLFLQRLFALGVWAATPAAPSRRHLARYAAARLIIAQEHPLLV